MKRLILQCLAAGLAALMLVPSAASAASFTLNSVQTGFFQNSGGTSNAPTLIEDSTRNNYFVFDLSAVTGKVTSAVLTIFANGNYSNPVAASSISYSLFDVQTPISKLLDGTGGSAAFADLGSGTQYGTTTVATPTSFAAMPQVTVALTGALTDLANAAGKQFAIGGDSSLTGNNGFLWISSSRSPAASLTLETAKIAPVPLPASLPLLAVAVGLIALLRRRA